MSGIYGFASGRPDADGARVLDGMFRALPAHGEVTKHHWRDTRSLAGVGAAHPARLGAPGHFAADASGSVVCVMDGVLFSGGEDPHGNPVEPDGAGVLLRRYLESGVDCLSSVSGCFHVAWWDGRTKTLTIASDRMGQRLLYYAVDAGRLTFASTVARVMAARNAPAEFDPEGIADLLSYGYVLGERTLFEGLRTLPPAGILVFDGEKAEVREYWRLDRVEPHGKYDGKRLEEFEQLFDRAVRRTVRQDMRSAVDLTGGLDSRCIFASAAAQDLDFVAHTGGQPDSTDVLLAQEVARRANVPHVFEPIGPDRLGDWLYPMVAYQGGMVATLHCHPCQHFDDDLPFDAVIQGIGATYARGHWVTPRNLDIEDAETAMSYLERRISTQTAKEIAPGSLWQPGYEKVGGNAARTHLRDLFTQFSAPDSVVSVMDYLALRERCRKFLNKAIMIVRGCREAYFPYLDHEFIEALARLPVAERVTHSIQTDLTRRSYPKLLRTPYEKTMIPLSASPLRKTATKAVRALRRRAVGRIPFVTPQPPKVPNHYYTKWTRTEMRPILADLLYNENAAFRAYLQWDTVERALDEHFSGQRSWEALLGALAVIEIAHRIWIEPSSVDAPMSSAAGR